MAKFATVANQTLGATVYYQIRSAILDGDFEPGDSLKIRKIADEMGVSVTPVRDALLQLVMERVLEMPNSREIVVPLISIDEFVEIRTLRVMIEGHAAETAASSASIADIKKLEELNNKIKKAYERKNTKQALIHNRAFHAYLYGIPKMPVLEDVLDRLWLRMAPLISSWTRYSDVHDFTDHHVAVIDALKKRDQKAARRAIAKDISEGGEKIVSTILISPKRSK